MAGSASGSKSVFVRCITESLLRSEEFPPWNAGMCSKAIKSHFQFARRIFLTLAASSVLNDFLHARSLQAMCHTHVFLSSLSGISNIFLQAFLKQNEALFHMSVSYDFRQTALQTDCLLQQERKNMSLPQWV